MLKLPNNFRFRRNWRGKLILQKKVRKTAFDTYESWEYDAWIDADWTDVVCNT
jgi:hypothetical protein